MENTLKLPVEIDNFEKLRTNNFYYVDKTKLIEQILDNWSEVSKESIFTGLNNFKVLSIMDLRFDEQFGFTDDEVKNLLATYGLDSCFTETKEWYDGYHFGNADVYCPWDVINYVDKLKQDGMRNFIKYGIACFKKDYKVMIGEPITR